jgi:hypothetical protein
MHLSQDCEQRNDCRTQGNQCRPNGSKLCNGLQTIEISDALHHRFFRRLRADLSIKKSSGLFPFFNAATIHFGFAPRPAHVSPDGLLYFGGTFLPFNDPFGALPVSAANCFSNSVRSSTNRLSICDLKLKRASTFIPLRLGMIYLLWRNSVIGLSVQINGRHGHRWNADEFATFLRTQQKFWRKALE